jgi:hypothetical protein
MHWRQSASTLWSVLFAGAASILASACTFGPPESVSRSESVIFATAGDPATIVDLTHRFPPEADLVLEEGSLTGRLHGRALTLNHDTPIHELVRVTARIGDRAIGTADVWHATQPADAPAWPITISLNGRYLEDRSGKPVLWTGDAAWGLMVVPDREDVTLYLRDRASKGVNAVLVRMIDHQFSDHRPPWLNAYGSAPFRCCLPGGHLRFDQPEAAYWAHVDWVLREAYRYGITVLGAPAYVGYQLGDQGWANQMLVNDTLRLHWYGRWLGGRYAAYPNLVWVLGGDWSSQMGRKRVTEHVDAVAMGIKSTDTVHLMTAHSHRGRSAVDDYPRGWLDVNSSYGRADTVHERVRVDYQRAPLIPTFLIEAHYGNEYGMTGRAVRAQMFQAMLGGAFGQIYGNAPQWYFSARSAEHFADERGLRWRDHLDGHGADALAVLAGLIRQYPLHELRPDHDHEVLVDGFGPENQAYAPLAYSDTLAIAYIPDWREITLDVSGLRKPLTVRWRRAADGAEAGAATTLHRSQVSLHPPGNGDWVLVVQSLPGLAEPGTASSPPG